MKKNGAFYAIYALEQIGVRKTFGIPGTYNSELYAQLFKSPNIEPIIVCSEQSAGYMADAVSRTSDTIGTIVIVQGAAITNAMSPIGQAFIDGIPIIIISGSNRQAGKDYQMHSINLNNALTGIVKKSYHIYQPQDIIPTIYQAYDLATGGCPGPVFIDIPLNIQSELVDLPTTPYQKHELKPLLQKIKDTSNVNLFIESETIETKIDGAVNLIKESKHPGIYVGWGAIDAVDEVKQLAELLAIPVCTTLQGVSAFPSNHPLHTGIGFGHFAVPAAQNAFNHCDCLIAIGLRFSELATANYQMPVPENLIHVDINPDVFHKNYHAKIAIEADSKAFLDVILDKLKKDDVRPKNDMVELSSSIQNNKAAYKKSWLAESNEQLVSPGFFFNALRNYFAKDAFLVLGNGDYKFLAAELFPVLEPRQFISPSDTNTMGYGIPATIATKIVHKHAIVIGIVSEAGLMHNGMELITAQYYKLGVIVFVLRDWVSGQEEIDNKEKNIYITTTVHKSIDIEKFAASIHAIYHIVKNDIDISGAMAKSKEQVKTGKNVLIEVLWDNSRKSNFTSGMLKPDISRISFLDKLKILFKSKE